MISIFMSVIVASVSIVAADKSSPHINFIDDPKNHAIDFSNGFPGPDGSTCVERTKYVDKTDINQVKECWIQNVTQCHYTYVTEYGDGEKQKCDDFYWKQCKIAFQEKSFNFTNRFCKRPLIKKCDDAYGAPPSAGYGPPKDNIVCETFFETECNTTDVVPAPGDEPLPVTFCDKVPRKICAPDNCQIVEGPEKCNDKTFESTIEQPVELCELQPQQHCSTVKVSVPRLIPEKRCRQVEKEICNTRLKNGQKLKKPVLIKYCTKKSVSVSSYLPPPPLPVYSNPPPQFSPSSPPPQVQYRPRKSTPVYNAAPVSPVYSRPLGAVRAKRDPVASYEAYDDVDIITAKPAGPAFPTRASNDILPVQAASVKSPSPAVDEARWSPVS